MASTGGIMADGDDYYIVSMIVEIYTFEIDLSRRRRESVSMGERHGVDMALAEIDRIKAMEAMEAMEAIEACENDIALLLGLMASAERKRQRKEE